MPRLFINLEVIRKAGPEDPAPVYLAVQTEHNEELHTNVIVSSKERRAIPQPAFTPDDMVVQLPTAIASNLVVPNEPPPQVATAAVPVQAQPRLSSRQAPTAHTGSSSQGQTSTRAQPGSSGVAGLSQLQMPTREAPATSHGSISAQHRSTAQQRGVPTSSHIGSIALPHDGPTSESSQHRSVAPQRDRPTSSQRPATPSQRSSAQVKQEDEALPPTQSKRPRKEALDEVAAGSSRSQGDLRGASESPAKRPRRDAVGTQPASTGEGSRMRERLGKALHDRPFTSAVPAEPTADEDSEGMSDADMQSEATLVPARYSSEEV